MIRKIHWRITDLCNRKCSYCFHRDKEKTGKIISNEDVEKACFFLKNKVSSDLKVNIVGGEPTMDRELNEKIRIIRENLNPEKISVATNGYNLKALDKDVFINLSVHEEYFDYYELLSKVKGLKKTRHKIMMMLSAHSWNGYILAGNILKALRYRVEFYPVLKNNKLELIKGIRYSKNFVEAKEKCYLDGSLLTINIEGKCKNSLCSQSSYLERKYI